MKQGFTMIELLIVIAIIGILAALILAGIKQAQNKAQDTAIRNDVGQLRILAEQIFDSQKSSFQNWSQYPDLQTDITTTLNDIDKQWGDSAGAPFVTTLRESQINEYCISAPLRSQAGKFYCVDASGVFATTTSACPDNPEGGSALRCP